MNKFLFLAMASSLTLGSLSASATVFDNKQDAVEIANALYKCGPELIATAEHGGEYVSSVRGEFAKISKGVTQKVYTITTATGGGFRARIPGATLRVTLKVTQPPEGLTDRPAKTEWTCEVIKK